MDNLNFFIGMFEFVGTVAFASSGAMAAIQKKLDLLGVLVLSVLTAVGGGVTRDIVIGKTPPATFTNPFTAITAVITGLVIFIILYISAKSGRKALMPSVYEYIMLIFDTVGLGVFTVMGVKAGIDCGYMNNMFLLVFLGTITGVGGGVIRDVMIKRVPYIFVKHIYAGASVLGAFTFAALFSYAGFTVAAVSGFSVTVLTRIMASKFKWNLPRV